MKKFLAVMMAGGLFFVLLPGVGLAAYITDSTLPTIKANSSDFRPGSSSPADHVVNEEGSDGSISKTFTKGNISVKVEGNADGFISKLTNPDGTSMRRVYIKLSSDEWAVKTDYYSANGNLMSTKSSKGSFFNKSGNSPEARQFRNVQNQNYEQIDDDMSADNALVDSPGMLQRIGATVRSASSKLVSGMKNVFNKIRGTSASKNALLEAEDHVDPVGGGGTNVGKLGGADFVSSPANSARVASTTEFQAAANSVEVGDGVLGEGLEGVEATADSVVEAAAGGVGG